MSRKIKIKEENSVWSHINYPDAIHGCLTFQKVFYKQKRFKKERMEYPKTVVDSDGYFLTGFIPRVTNYLEDRNIGSEVDLAPDLVPETKRPALEGITFRDDQYEAINMMRSTMRGVWQAPTGSGKTIVMAGLISSFYNSRALIIVHTSDLFEQTYNELRRFCADVGRVGCGYNQESDITVAMIQTLNKRSFSDGFGYRWELLIVDEAHHVRKFDGSYAKVLGSIYAQARFGLTATLPPEGEGLFAMEGYLGPVIGETPQAQLQDSGILAKPIVKLRYVPETARYKKLKGGYHNVYDEGIVNNRGRNKLIVTAAQEYIDKGLTVLIMVERIEHGENLLRLCEILMPGRFVFLHGDTEDEIREEEKSAFINKDRRGVIATRIWSEGTNIRSIGVVINAVGGVSEIATLQRFGRGLRTTEGKDSVYLVDFFDSNHIWFLRHSGKRVCMYFEQGWI